MNALRQLQSRSSGKERDSETGLDYFGARYYVSAFARFLSVDPALDSAVPDDPQTWNRYVYALNSPLIFIDTDGRYVKNIGSCTLVYWIPKPGAHVDIRSFLFSPSNASTPQNRPWMKSTGVNQDQFSYAPNAPRAPTDVSPWSWGVYGEYEQALALSVGFSTDSGGKLTAWLIQPEPIDSVGKPTKPEERSMKSLSVPLPQLGSPALKLSELSVDELNALKEALLLNVPRGAEELFLEMRAQVNDELAARRASSAAETKEGQKD